MAALTVYIIGKGKAALNQKAAFLELHDIYQITEDQASADIISICTPTGDHFKRVISCLTRNQACFVEKPMTTSLAHALEMYRAAEGSGVPLLPISNFRFTNPPSDLVLHINYKRSPEYYSKVRWRGTWDGAGGGALMTQGWHVIDALLEVEDEFVSVSCNIQNLWHDIAVEDYAHVELTTASGQTYTRTITTAPHDLDGACDPDVLGSRHVGLVRQFEDFYDCVREGSTPYIGCQNALLTMTILTACYYSAAIQRPVRLDSIYEDPHNHPFFLGWQSLLAKQKLRQAVYH